MFEAYCGAESEKQCPHRVIEITAECFADNCKNLSFCEAADEIAVTDGTGRSAFDIGFGGDMETSEEEREENILRWRDICKDKINEAYSEYMRGK